jgi:hypothetical protein
MREAIAYLQQGLCLIAIASLTAFSSQAMDSENLTVKAPV